MVLLQVTAVLIFWLFSKSQFFPSINDTYIAFKKLISQDDLIAELLTSTLLCLQSLAIAVFISLLISYLSVVPFFRPFAFIVTKFRFLTLVGLSFFFNLITHSGHGLKVSLMVFGITVFFVTSMLSVIQAITKNEFNHARTLRMNEWEVVKEVIILGKLDQVFEIIRQTFAISWMMLTMVEGISRAEGGVGTLLLNQNKHLQLDAIFATQIAILIIGISMDYLIGFMKNMFFPYANLALQNK
jgi:NitT/TauT family transport system permease protein